MTHNSSGPALVERLEKRNYAASTEKVMTVLNDPNPSATVMHYQVHADVKLADLPRVQVRLDAAKTVTVQGRSGDDNVRIRVVHGGLEIRTNTRWSYTYYTSDGRKWTLHDATTTFEDIYKFSRKEFTSLVVNGGRGADSLRLNGVLPSNPIVTSVENAAVSQDFVELPAGQTPSDATARPGGWLKVVADEKGAANYRVNSDVALFGDSHVAHFLDWGRNAWQFKLRRPAVFGIGGDDTRNLLYRIQDGIFDNYKPKKLIVSVGTNNFNNPQTGGTDEQIFQGVLKVMTELRKRLPDAELVLISLLPRAGLGLNARVEALNNRLDAADNDNGFVFLNLYARFSNLTKKSPGTSYRFEINPFGNDSHYNSVGYGILADSLAQLLKIGFYSLSPETS